MKESFKKPKMQMISFEAEDIIITSGGCTSDCDPVCENHCKSGICTGNCYSDTRATNIM